MYRTAATVIGCSKIMDTKNMKMSTDSQPQPQNQPKTILLFGKNGQVGWELQRSLSSLGRVIALDFDSTDFCGDFSNLAGLRATVDAILPDVIVNASAHTAVDKAENEPEFARVLNALAPKILAQAAHQCGAWLVHYSTDYVFDGCTTDAPWTETDAPAPCNVYGQTKWEGEQYVAQHCQKHLIFRTSWVYAARGGNFAKTMLRLAQEKTELNVINDQIGAPTGADLLADVTALVLHQVLNQSTNDKAGLYHVTASGETSWHGYAKTVLQQAKRTGVNLKVTAEQLNGIPTSQYPTPAQRPLNSRLNNTLFQNTFGLHLPHWQLGIERMLFEIL